MQQVTPITTTEAMEQVLLSTQSMKVPSQQRPWQQVPKSQTEPWQQVPYHNTQSHATVPNHNNRGHEAMAQYPITTEAWHKVPPITTEAMTTSNRSHNRGHGNSTPITTEAMAKQYPNHNRRPWQQVPKSHRARWQQSSYQQHSRPWQLVTKSQQRHGNITPITHTEAMHNTPITTTEAMATSTLSHTEAMLTVAKAQTARKQVLLQQQSHVNKYSYHTTEAMVNNKVPNHNNGGPWKHSTPFTTRGHGHSPISPQWPMAQVPYHKQRPWQQVPKSQQQGHGTKAMATSTPIQPRGAWNNYPNQTEAYGNKSPKSHTTEPGNKYPNHNRGMATVPQITTTEAMATSLPITTTGGHGNSYPNHNRGHGTSTPITQRPWQHTQNHNRGLATSTQPHRGHGNKAMANKYPNHNRGPMGNNTQSQQRPWQKVPKSTQRPWQQVLLHNEACNSTPITTESMLTSIQITTVGHATSPKSQQRPWQQVPPLTTQRPGKQVTNHNRGHGNHYSYPKPEAMATSTPITTEAHGNKYSYHNEAVAQVTLSTTEAIATSIQITTGPWDNNTSYHTKRGHGNKYPKSQRGHGPWQQVPLHNNRGPGNKYPITTEANCNKYPITT
ncbi:uncharacterized protein LOC119597143 [Penaeus monodon]|uniref:uncharacterized protein LOC119597143 n=1 Tax=Penaeus monodon TaxID=6687 RepID=UPI0018A7A57F|nr:uncharacterized protein LOC119597143 [Penaeus monodon]